jgi:hypothetical protein
MINSTASAKYASGGIEFRVYCFAERRNFELSDPCVVAAAG